MYLAMPGKYRNIPNITVGSPKQIAWANGLRASVAPSEIDYWSKRGAGQLVYEYLAQPKCRSAVFWIDHRNDTHYITDDITHYVYSHGYKPVTPAYEEEDYDIEALFV